MKTFFVERKEIHISVIKIQAENEDDARQIVGEDAGDELGSFYHSTLDPSEWEVTQEKEFRIKGFLA